MSETDLRSRPGSKAVALMAIAAVFVHMSGAAFVRAQEPAAAPATVTEEASTGIPPEQLESLVAPIALYPDALLAQVLVASTYPLEIMQLQQWLAKNPDLEGDALADAVAEQPWDPSIQSMAAVPEALERLANDIQWTTELGNAFLAQQSDVMDAVQSMRQKAQDNGALESTEQQKVETQVVEEKTVIIVESADPEVIYVPSYNPTYVYPPPVYPYPPVYYPPYYAGGAFVSFSIGVMWGSAIWGGSCCHCGWGHNDINIDIDNNFNRNTNIDRGDRGGGSWQHDPQHRGGAPYADRATADKFGGTARGDSMASRQASARQQGGSRSSAPSAGGMDRSAGAAGGRSGAPSAGGMDRSTGGGAGGRSSAPSASSLGGSGGGDKIGSRSIPSSGGPGASGFGGSSSGFSGSSARSASSRGASSMGSMQSRGGGASRGGGGRRR
ncbi:MAG: DUF3300 domain-containing protein [Acidobacteriota bacterium]